MPYGRRRRTSIRRARRTIKKPARTIRRRTIRKRYARRSLRTKWPTPLVPFARRCFRYNDTGFSGATATPGYVYWYVFRGNSLYDPDYTGIGVQPYGYDQLTGLFGKFRVAGSKIKIWTRTKTTEQAPLKIAIWPQETATQTTDFADLAVRPGSKTINFQWTDPSNKKCISQYKSTRWVLREFSSGDENLSHDLGGNPNQQWYWIILFSTYDAALPISFTFDVEIKYYAICRQSVLPVNES